MSEEGWARVEGLLECLESPHQDDDALRIERVVDAVLAEHEPGPDLWAPDVMDGDDQRISHAVQSALHTKKAKRRRNPATFLAVAAVLLLVGSASALTLGREAVVELWDSWVGTNHTSDEPSEAQHAPRAETPIEAEVQPQEAIAEFAPVTPPEVVDPLPQAPRRVRRRVRVREPEVIDDVEPEVAPAPSADELLEQANRARSAGQWQDAVRGYSELQRQYPTSRAARVSYVSAGRLLARHNRHADALSAFESYLRVSPSGSLAEPARTGRAMALRRLGRRDQERTAWRDLLRHHPDAPSAAIARRYLSE